MPQFFLDITKRDINGMDCLVSGEVCQMCRIRAENYTLDGDALMEFLGHHELHMMSSLACTRLPEMQGVTHLAFIPETCITKEIGAF